MYVTLLPVNRYRIVIVVMSLFLTLVNYLDRSLISYAISPLSEGLGLSNALFGLIIAIFAAGCLCANGVGSYAMNKWGMRTIWLFALLLWSISAVFMGLIHSFIGFLFFRFLLGLGEGFNFAAFNAAMNAWVSKDKLNRAMAFCLLGIPLANIMGAPLFSNLIVVFHWRFSFILLGFLGLLVTYVWWFLFHDKPSDIEEAEFMRTPLPESLPAPSLKSFLAVPGMLSVCWSFFAFGYVLFFAITWLPGYFEQTYSMHLDEIRFFLMPPWVIALILMLFSAYIADRLFQRDGESKGVRLYPIWICQLLSIFCFIPVLMIHAVDISLWGLSLGIGIALMPSALYFRVCSALAPEQVLVTTGIMISFFSLAGIVSPLLTGILVDHFGNFDAAIVVLVLVLLSSVLALSFSPAPCLDPEELDIL